MFEEAIIPLDQWVSAFVDLLVDDYRDVFQMLKWPVEQMLNGFEQGLSSIHPLIVITVIAVAALNFLESDSLFSVISPCS